MAATSQTLPDGALVLRRQVDVTSGDPLLALLRERLRLPDSTLLGGLGVAGALVLLGGPALAGSPLSRPSSIVALLYSIGLLPLAAWVYLTLADKLESLFNELQSRVAARQLSPGRQASYEQFVADLRRWLSSPWWAVAAVVAVVLYWLYRPLWLVPAAIEGEVTPSAHIWLRVAVIPVFSIALYGFCMSLVRMTLAMLFTQRLLREFRVIVDPLAPDGAGGLGPIGSMFALTMIICIALGGIALAMSAAIISVGLNPLDYLETRVLAGLYLILLPTSLVVWLWLPHLALQEARALALRPVADAFLRAFAQGTPAPPADVQNLKADTDVLVELKRRYDVVDSSIPMWPLRLPALRGLSVTALIPLVTGLISAARTILSAK